ncbi:hypothetical protein SNEBB_011263 [Seison nebaliae]|nr:hypothetical protein SNEBB_011263 [Seison nebaliae]
MTTDNNVQMELNDITDHLQMQLNQLLDSGIKSTKRYQLLQQVRDRFDCCELKKDDYFYGQLFDLIGENYLLKLFDDRLERTRELTVDYFIEIFRNMSEEKRIAVSQLFLPIISRRLELKDENQVEQSEYIHVKLLKLIELSIVVSSSLEEKLKLFTKYFVDHYLIILRSSIRNQNYEIKISSQQITKRFCEVADEQALRQSIGTLVGDMTRNLVHQRYAVRRSGIDALNKIGLVSDSSIPEKLLPIFCQKHFDYNIQVRQSLLELAFDWLQHLRDRYSFHPRLLSLFLTFFSDENEIIREKTREMWNLIGIQFAKENEDDLKDQLDYGRTPPLHYPFYEEEKSIANHYLKDRPNFGCRELLYRHTYKIIPALLNDIDDWNELNRYKALNLLGVIVIHNEHHMTQHSSMLINRLMKSYRKDDVKGNRLIDLIFYFLSHFISTRIWWEILKKEKKLISNDSDQIDRFIRNLRYLIEGSGSDMLNENVELINEIVMELVGDEMIMFQSMMTNRFYDNLFHIFPILFEKLREKEGMRMNTFLILSSIRCFTPDQHHLLPLIEKFQTENEFHHQFRDENCGNILEFLSSSHKNWSTGIDNRRTLFFQTINYLHNHIASSLPLIIDVCCRTMKKNVYEFNNLPERDIGAGYDEKSIQMKESIGHSIQYLIDLFEIEGVLSNLNKENGLLKLFPQLLNELFLPTLRYCAGKIAEANRLSSAVCLQHLLNEFDVQLIGTLSTSTPLQQLEEMEENVKQFSLNGRRNLSLLHQLLYQLLLTIDDDSSDTRYSILQSINQLFLLSLQHNEFSIDELHSIQLTLLKRLNDSRSFNRLYLIQHLLFNFIKLLKISNPLSIDEKSKQLFVSKSPHRPYDNQLYCSHVDHLFTTLLLHLDDPEINVRSAMEKLIVEEVVELDEEKMKSLIEKNLKRQKFPEHLKLCLSKLSIN